MKLKTSKFYDSLLQNYFTLNVPEKYSKLAKINSEISWYFSDEDNIFISSKSKFNNNIIELDIKSAFQTICNSIYDSNLDFIKNMNKIEDKEKRNKFISTNLKKMYNDENNNINNSSYLSDLTSISKTIIFGIIIDNFSNDIEILEIKKDSCIIICNNNTKYIFENLNESKSNFTKFILDHGFKFNFKNYDKYIRYNKTSIFTLNDEIIFKGLYKYRPNFINKITKDILNDSIQLDEIKKIYSKKYLNIILNNNIIDLFNYYYLCEDNKILLNGGNYFKMENSLKNIIDPYTYLSFLVFPLILSNKI